MNLPTLNNEIDATCLVKFIAQYHGATQECPLVLGEVRFWLEDDELRYDPPAIAWNILAVSQSLREEMASLWDAWFKERVRTTRLAAL